jgi:transcriptional regulator
MKMYTPKHFSTDSKELELAFIQQNPFATIMSVVDGEMANITKVPLILKENNGEYFLEGHMSRANPHWEVLLENGAVTVMLDGPHDYINPMWYENPSVSVPTWNYSTAIIDGHCEITESSDWIKESVLEMSRIFQPSDAWEKQFDQEKFDNLAHGIVGVKIEIDNIQVKLKNSQNRSVAEQANILAKLD